MGFFGFYAGIFKPHVFRKKSVILIVLIALALIVFCFQYSSTLTSEVELRKEDGRGLSNHKYNDIIRIGDLFQKPGEKSVQFLVVVIF